MQTLINAITTWANHKDDEAPAWIFTLDHVLSENDRKNFEKDLSLFLSGWKSHGKDPQGEFLIWQNQVILITADHPPSGCGQDELHRQIKAIANKYGLNAYRGEKLVFAREGEVTLKDRADFNCNHLDSNDLWLNTGVSKAKSLKNATIFRVPSEVF